MADTIEVAANQTEGQAEASQGEAQTIAPTLEELQAERTALVAERDQLKKGEARRTQEVVERDRKIHQLSQQTGRMDRIEQRLDEIAVGLKYALSDPDEAEPRPKTRYEQYQAELQIKRAPTSPSQSAPEPSAEGVIAWGKMLGLYEGADLNPAQLPPEIAQAHAEAVQMGNTTGDLDGAVKHVKDAIKARAKAQAEEAGRVEKERKAAILKKGQAMQTDKEHSQGGDLGTRQILEKPASQMTPQERRVFLDTVLGGQG